MGCAYLMGTVKSEVPGLPLQGRNAPPPGVPHPSPNTRPDFMILQMFPTSEAARPGHKHKINDLPHPGDKWFY